MEKENAMNSKNIGDREKVRKLERLERERERKLKKERVNPFHPDCKAISSRIFQHFFFIFQFLRPEHDCHAIHILLCIKNNQNNTFKHKNYIN